MSGFAADWLALREPFDRAARSGRLAAEFAAAAVQRAAAPVVLDLGAGTGAGAAYLAPFLPIGHRWVLVDNDPDLLDAARAMRHLPDAEYRCLDLAGRLDDVDWSAVDAVSATALLDLVSEAWMAAFARCCAGNRLPVLCALIYDGRMGLAPPHAADTAIFAAFNRHQGRDKGFGAALGPAAAAVLERELRGHGYRIETETADWRLERHDGAILAEFMDGVGRAVAEMAEGDTGSIAEWTKTRRRQIAKRSLSAHVGHVDVLALPDI